MCGHLGFHLLKPAPDQVPAMMAAMGIFMDMRGGHAWGYWADNMPIRKGLGKISENLSAQTFKNSTRVIAHSRWATHGSNTKENAHPFVQKTTLDGQEHCVIGAHNGVVTNHRDMNKKYGREFDVDSQHIFQHLADNIEPKNDLYGYGTIFWVDSRQQDLTNFCTFNSGSLAIAEVWASPAEDEEYLGVVWASTELALLVGLTQAGFGHKILRTKDAQRYFIDQHAKAYEFTDMKFDVNWAAKWTGTEEKHDYTSNGAYKYTSHNHRPAVQIYRNGQWFTGRTENGKWVETAEAVETESTEDQWANRLVEIAEAVDKRIAGEVSKGKDVDDLIHTLWRRSGTFYHKGQCFGCSERTEVVKHKELLVRMCFGCACEWEELNSTNDQPVEIIRNAFISQIAKKRGVPMETILRGLALANNTKRDYIEGVGITQLALPARTN